MGYAAPPGEVQRWGGRAGDRGDGGAAGGGGGGAAPARPDAAAARAAGDGEGGGPGAGPGGARRLERARPAYGAPLAATLRRRRGRRPGRCAALRSEEHTSELQ